MLNKIFFNAHFRPTYKQENIINSASLISKHIFEGSLVKNNVGPTGVFQCENHMAIFGVIHW